MVPNTSDDLPDPETPVNTVSRRLGISMLMSLRLFSRAPCTRMRSWLSAGCRLEEDIHESCHRLRAGGRLEPGDRFVDGHADASGELIQLHHVVREEDQDRAADRIGAPPAAEGAGPAHRSRGAA